MRVIVIGGGISGLIVAASLAKRGIEVTICEKSDQIGGLAASFVRSGCTYDLGPHIFFAKNIIPALNEFFDAERVIAENNRLSQAIYIQGKLFSHPFRPKEILARIDRKKLPRAIVESVLSSIAMRSNQATLEEWVSGRIGKTLYDYIELDTYVKKLYGIPAREISSDWGKHRLKPIANLSLWRLINAAINPWEKPKGRYTYYCEGGIGQVADHLSKYVISQGGKIHLRSSVDRVIAGNKKITEVSISHQGKRRTEKADIVVSSILISDLIRMIEPKAAPEVCAAVSSLRHRNLIILYMVVEKEKLFDQCLVYFSTRETVFKRITEYKHFWPGMVPKHLTSLSAEICVDPGDDMWRHSDREIFERVVREMEQLGLLSESQVLEYFTVRIPAVYPVYFLDYERQLKVVFEYLSTMTNLVSLGRRGLYQHDNMATAIESGLEVGRLIAANGIENSGETSRAVYRGRLDKYRNV